MEEDRLNTKNQHLKTRNLLEKILSNAEKEMLSKSAGLRWTDFKECFCLRHSPYFGWGLTVNDLSNHNEMSWVTSIKTGKVLKLPETFIEKAKTEDNDMIIQASIGDSSINLPILGNDIFKLPSYALDIVLECMMEGGAVICFSTELFNDIKVNQSLKIKELMNTVAAADREFGRNSLQANATRKSVLQKLMIEMPNELATGMLEIKLVQRHFSCVEELAMNLDLDEEE
jgi:hypothetical protein